MGRLASKQGGSGGAQPPQHCKRIVSKNPSKIDPKSIKNRPKVDQKSIKIDLGGYRGVLVVSWRFYGRSGGVLGGVLAASWGVPEVSWGALGRLLAAVGASWAVLGAS